MEGPCYFEDLLEFDGGAGGEDYGVVRCEGEGEGEEGYAACAWRRVR